MVLCRGWTNRSANGSRGCAGDEPAAAKLWQRYYERLVRLACKKLGSHPARAADEEDVAVSAFQSFCQRATGEPFPNLHDRDDLWHLLRPHHPAQSVRPVEGRQAKKTRF